MPIKWFPSGDKEKAVRELTGLGLRALYIVKNWRKVGNLKTKDSGWITYADGSKVRAISSFNLDQIHLYAPIKGAKKMVEEEKIPGLTLQWYTDDETGAPYYSGAFVDLKGLRIKNYKSVLYPQDPGYRYAGNTNNGAIVESDGHYAYGFGVEDAIFRIALSSLTVTSLDLKSDYSTVNHHCFDDKHNILYVTLANGNTKSDIYRVFTRPDLAVDVHITTIAPAWISNLAVNPNKNILYACQSGKQEYKDTTADGVKVTFTHTMSTPLSKAAVGLFEMGGTMTPDNVYYVACDDGSSTLVNCLNWLDGIPMASGTVNHSTGAISITFSSPPPTGSTVYFWSSPSQVIMYVANTLTDLGTPFNLPSNKQVSYGPYSIIDKDDNFICITYPVTPYLVNKYSYDGNLLGQVAIPDDRTPMVIAYGGVGKYAYIATYTTSDNNAPIYVYKLNLESMVLENSVSIPRTTSNRPFVLSVDPLTNKVYMVNRYVNNVYEINGNDLTYKDLAENNLHDNTSCGGYVIPYNWNPFCETLGMSNKAFYKTSR